jgi:hypothetical protein
VISAVQLHSFKNKTKQKLARDSSAVCFCILKIFIKIFDFFKILIDFFNFFNVIILKINLKK